MQVRCCIQWQASGKVGQCQIVSHAQGLTQMQTLWQKSNVFGSPGIACGVRQRIQLLTRHNQITALRGHQASDQRQPSRFTRARWSTQDQSPTLCHTHIGKMQCGFAVGVGITESLGMDH